MYLCVCKAITESDVERLAAAGVTDTCELMRLLDLDEPSACGRCLDDPERFECVARRAMFAEADTRGASRPLVRSRRGYLPASPVAGRDER